MDVDQILGDGDKTRGDFGGPAHPKLPQVDEGGEVATLAGAKTLAARSKEGSVNRALRGVQVPS